jgi:hypothetical protein
MSKIKKKILLISLDESDALVTTRISKSQYSFIKPLAGRVDQFRSSQDNILLAVKRLPHPLEDFKKQRQNYREIRILKHVFKYCCIYQYGEFIILD